VTVCHSRTADLAGATRNADVLFVAAGLPRLIGAAQVAPGQVVIDAGISFLEGKMVGDVDQAAVAEVVAAITPVPGGVGPLTSTLIFANLLRAMDLQGLGEPQA
jgi:methylenetetrahydrofolate dehydrogenase (NADP+)/methenyltetrahydrofolate cyclohydrolase